MNTFFGNMSSVLKTVHLIDLIDVLSVAFIIYYAVRLARETRAMQLVKSIGVIFMIYFIAKNLEMATLEFFMRMVLDVGLIVLVVLFQPELRRALERIGRSRITDLGKIGGVSFGDEKTQALITILCESCEDIIRKGDGALIVLERETRLGDIVNTGTVIDAEPSAALIGNVFFTNAPLHDGAMVIRDGRVYAAGCFLPLSDNADIGRELGTRHRAAMGVSEISDAVTIVVSEERGAISVAEDSRLQQGLSPKNLEKVLQNVLMDQDKEQKKGWFGFGGRKK